MHIHIQLIADEGGKTMGVAWVLATTLGRKVLLTRLALLFLDAAALGLGAQMGRHVADMVASHINPKKEEQKETPE